MGQFVGHPRPVPTVEKSTVGLASLETTLRAGRTTGTVTSTYRVSSGLKNENMKEWEYEECENRVMKNERIKSGRMVV